MRCAFLSAVPAQCALVAATLAVPVGARANVQEPIQDNSFLVEEAYNQEPGVIQHISAFTRTRAGAWAYSFTEEWPVLGQRHQASVSFGWAGLEAPGSSGFGDVALNYRLQVVGNGDAPVAFSPRLTVLLPTGDAGRGLGSGGTGLQVNLPLSVVLSDRLVSHTNLGGTWIPSALASTGGHGPLTSLAAGQGLVWLAHRRLNFLAEVIWARTELAGPAGIERDEDLTLNPGVRAGFDLAGGLQVVPGVSFPIGVGPSRGERAILLYVSFEHPFRLAGPTEEPEPGESH